MVKIQVEVFSFVTPCSVVVRYRSFRGLWWLHPHFALKMEAARFSETCHNPEDLDLNFVTR
jgi:hypothetical protein